MKVSSHFNFARKLLKRSGLHRLADSVKKKPRALLGYTNRAVNLIATDSVLRADDTAWSLIHQREGYSDRHEYKIVNRTRKQNECESDGDEYNHKNKRSQA